MISSLHSSMEYLLFPLFSFSASSNTLNPAYPSFFTHEKQDSSKRTTQILKIGIKTNVSRRIIFKPSSNIKIRSKKGKRIRRIVVIGGKKKEIPSNCISHHHDHGMGRLSILRLRSRSRVSIITVTRPRFTGCRGLLSSLVILAIVTLRGRRLGHRGRS